jgi:hypothetical protein
MTETTSPIQSHDTEALDASGETALVAVERAGAASLSLIEAWIQRGNIAAVAEVAERCTGAERKAARRGLNVLRARGVAIPERPHVASLGRAKVEEAFEAWLLAPDASGSVLMVIAAHTPSSRYRALLTYLNDTWGVQRADYVEVAWSQLKDTMHRTAAGSGVKPVKIPVEWARARVARARERNRESRLLEPLGLERATSLLEPVPATPPAHPLDEEGLELTVEDARELARSSATLHRLPEFRGWMPSREAVDAMMVEVGKQLTPGEQPERAHVEQLLNREIDAATDRYFSPQIREQVARTMKDSALSVLEREGEQAALETVAAITCVEAAGLITDPPHEVPFLRGFFEKAVAVLAAQSQGNLRIPVPAPPTLEGLEDAPAPEDPPAELAAVEGAKVSPETGESAEGSAPAPDAVESTVSAEAQTTDAAEASSGEAGGGG